MAKVTAVALQTLAGSYGVAGVGDKITLDEKHARQLADRGAVEIVGDDSDEDVKEKKETSFTITDNTGNKEKAEQETDPENPTGKEKDENAGPKGGRKK